MAQRRHHYEHAFEDYLRRRRVPYVGVDEARRALLPDGARLTITPRPGDQTKSNPLPLATTESLKSFDFVVYEGPINRLVEVKGRKIPLPSTGPPRPGRLETWITEDDVRALTIWQDLFGPGFKACIVFLYWCYAQPPDGLFQEVFPCRDRWYAMRSVDLDDYVQHMRPRSKRWRTVHIPSSAFTEISEPFRPALAQPPRSLRAAAAGPQH